MENNEKPNNNSKIKTLADKIKRWEAEPSDSLIYDIDSKLRDAHLKLNNGTLLTQEKLFK